MISEKFQQAVSKVDDNIQLYIVMNVKDSILEISSKNGYQLIPITPIVVEISMKEMENLSKKLLLCCTGKCDGFDSDSLDVHVSDDG